MLRFHSSCPLIANLHKSKAALGEAALAALVLQFPVKCE